MDDFRNIDFTNYLIVFDGNILGISVAPGELMADGDLKKYADCRTPEYAAWINLKQAKMICRVKFAGMDKFSLPIFSENNTINIPEHAFNAIEHMAELLLLPMDGSSGFSAPMALPDWNFSYHFANDGDSAYWSVDFILFASSNGSVLEKASAWNKMPNQRTILWDESAIVLYNVFNTGITLPSGYQWRSPGTITAPGAGVEIIREFAVKNPLWREFEAIVSLNFYSLKSFNDAVSAITGMMPFQNEEMRLDLIEAEQSKYCTPFFNGNVRIRVRLPAWN